VWTRGQALRVTSVGRYDALVRGNSWQTLWPGVHADAGFDLDAVQRAIAAVLGSGGADQAPERVEGPPERWQVRLRAYACGRTAARAHGFVLIDDDDPATGAQDHLHDDVGVLGHLPDVEHDGRVLHRHQLRLRPGDLVRLPSGLWTTSAARTLVDCAGVLTGEALVCALDDLLHRHVLDLDELGRQVARVKGRRHAPALRQAVALADRRAEAPSETLARLLLLPHLPGLQPQVRLFDARGACLARFDLGEQALRLAVESDGRRAHEGATMVAKDRRRDRHARRHGWETERLTWFDLRRRQAESVGRVLDLAAHQRQRWAA
jgi:hypothetical protein